MEELEPIFITDKASFFVELMKRINMQREQDYAPINVNPVGGGGGSAGKGRGFDGEVHPLSGRFDLVPLLGGRDI